jgi:hypothetical protein
MRGDQDQIAQKAADDAKTAADKRKAAIDAAAQKQREADAKERASINASVKHLLDVRNTLRQKFAAALGNVRSEIGGLFQGPLLAPTAANTRQVLGLAGPSAAGFAADLRAQTAQASRFEGMLNKLRARARPQLGKGGTQQLISELRGQGVGALPEIQALAGASAPQLTGFLSAFKAREKFAVRTASMMVAAQRVHLVAKEPIVVDLIVNLDGKVVSRVVTQHQQKNKGKNAASNRGRSGGVNVGG